MKSHITTHVFALALLLAGCAGSDDGDGTATSPSVDGFITKEEAAEQASGQAATGTESDFIAEPPSGIAGSGIVIGQSEAGSQRHAKTSWRREFENEKRDQLFRHAFRWVRSFRRHHLYANELCRASQIR
jgi:hypothetical protein